MNLRAVVLVTILVAFVANVDAGLFDSLPRSKRRAKGRYMNLIVFGDSIADTGNAKTFVGWPQLPYYNGRFSNGPVWNEYLAEFQGMRLINYAYGGASSDSDLSVGRMGGRPPGLPVPGMKQQIEKFLSESYMSLEDYFESCTTVWLNGNNYIFNTSNTGEEVVKSMFANADTLYQQGIRCFIFGDIADLSQFPAYRAATEEQQAYILNAIKEHNAAITQTIPKWTTNHPGVEIFRYNFNADLHVIKGPSNPLRISNFTYGCIEEPIETGIRECADPDNYAFYDQAHPTTKIHWFVAKSIDQILRGKPQLGMAS